MLPASVVASLLVYEQAVIGGIVVAMVALDVVDVAPEGTEGVDVPGEIPVPDESLSDVPAPEGLPSDVLVSDEAVLDGITCEIVPLAVSPMVH